MKILYYHQHFSTTSGSAGTRSYEMAKALIKNGHDVTMLCGSYGMGITGLTGDYIKGKREGMVDGIHIIEYELPYNNADGFIKRSLTFLKYAFKSLNPALFSKYDIIFATSTPLTAGISGIAAHIFRRKKFIFEVRDLWPELPREMGVITNPLILGAMSILEWSSYHAAKACIGLSPGIVQGIEKRGIESKNIFVVPNGCDLEIFKPKSPQEIAKITRPDKVKKDDLMAIFTGAHGMANGLDAALDAANYLKKQNRTDIKLVFIGDGKLKKDLQKRASNENLDNCIFLNPMPKAELAQLMQQADVGMMLLSNIPAFYYGTSPNKFFDYIATGLPVLNNYPGWLAEMISENNCGKAIPPDNPEEFAKALISLADDRDTLKKMGENSRKLAEKKFDRKILAKKFVTTLEKIGGNA